MMSPDLCHGLSLASLPGPCPAFHCLQYRKAGRAWFLLSCEQDVINKWQKNNSEWRSQVLHIVWPTTSSMLAWCVWQSPLTRYVCKVTWYLSSSCCSVSQCTHVHLTPFYPISTLTSRTWEKIPGPLHSTSMCLIWVHVSDIQTSLLGHQHCDSFFIQFVCPCLFSIFFQKVYW